MSTARLAAAAAACITVAALGCAHKRPPEVSPEFTSARVHRHEVRVADDIMKACDIEDQDRTPKFDFDSSDLMEADRQILAQVARCLTTGPLKGRGIELVGRADPRGETEYNMILGQSRAGSVNKYLAALGVDATKMVTTSRGELDATGTDEESWQLDRRVDLSLSDEASAMALDKP
jgi:peptidoglycan-associated lipoprotein